MGGKENKGRGGHQRRQKSTRDLIFEVWIHKQKLNKNALDTLNHSLHLSYLLFTSLTSYLSQWTFLK